jgi:hypothetical protein
MFFLSSLILDPTASRNSMTVAKDNNSQKEALSSNNCDSRQQLSKDTVSEVFCVVAYRKEGILIHGGIQI